MFQYGMKKTTTSLIEDKMKDKVQRAHTHRNLIKVHASGELLLWHKMVAVCCLIWPPVLRMWSGRQTKIQLFKSSISGRCI